MKKLTLAIAVFLSSLAFFSQEIKFGKVSINELSEKFYELDSTAPAAILLYKRNSQYEIVDNLIQIEEEYFVRMKIYNPEGYKNATVSIPYFQSSEDIFGLKAATYNLENGQIVKTDLEKDNIFIEKTTKKFVHKKFTMPNLKPGCIIEFTYKITSPNVVMLNDVKLQRSIPVKRNLIKIKIPEFLVYLPKTKGYLTIPLKIGMEINNRYDFRENVYSVDMANVPALIDEPYNGNSENYMSGIKFEINLTRIPGQYVKNYSIDWKAVIKEINLSENFGGQLKEKNYFIEDINTVIAGKQSELEKTLAVFNFVKSKIKFNDYSSIETDLGVKKAYKEGVGNSADINLNLVNMLRHIGLDAKPVLISTIENGIPIFPSIAAFDHVIVSVMIGGEKVLLDATNKHNAVNVIDEDNLNFYGYEIYQKEEFKEIPIYPIKHALKKTIINAKFSDGIINGNSRTINNAILALNYRKEFADKGKELQSKLILENYNDIDLLDFRINNLEDPEKEVNESIMFETESYFEEISNKLYISPLLFHSETINPFKSEKREYPIYFNYPFIETVIVNFTIPEGYKVESLPDNKDFTAENDLGGFKYKISANETSIQIESYLVVNEPVVQAQYYDFIKTLYKEIISKHSEKIILSKI